jgi:HEPN domain-containing protein
VPQGSRERPATYNALCAIENLPQAFASRLTDAQVQDFMAFFQSTFECLDWSAGLPSTPLLQVARDDYSASTSDFFADRFGQSRWGAQQAIEKTLKGLLTLGGTAFPKDGHRGHDLLTLAQLLHQHHGITLDPTALNSAKCTAKIRYGEDPSSELDTLAANHAVLTVWANLGASAELAALLPRQ